MDLQLDLMAFGLPTAFRGPFRKYDNVFWQVLCVMGCFSMTYR